MSSRHPKSPTIGVDNLHISSSPSDPSSPTSPVTPNCGASFAFPTIRVETSPNRRPPLLELESEINAIRNKSYSDPPVSTVTHDSDNDKDFNKDDDDEANHQIENRSIDSSAENQCNNGKENDDDIVFHHRLKPADQDSVVGSGSYCRVYKAVTVPEDQSITESENSPRPRANNNVYAVKVPMNPTQASIVTREAHVLSLLTTTTTAAGLAGAAGIVKFHGLYPDTSWHYGCPGLVMDLYWCTALDYIQNISDPVKYNTPYVGMDLWTKWTEQLCHGLAYIHSKGVVHCDIKPDNILVDHDLNVYIADFASAILSSSASSSSSSSSIGLSTFAGGGFSILYAAPELLTSSSCVKSCTFSTDDYSLGLVLLVLATGSEPYSAAVKGASQKLMWAQKGVPLQACTPEDECRISLPSVRSLLTKLLVERKSVDSVM